MGDFQDNAISEVSNLDIRSTFKIYQRLLRAYKDKNPELSDDEWLCDMFRKELPEKTEEDIRSKVSDVYGMVHQYDAALTSVNEAAEKGVSKEKWLSNRIQESAVGVSAAEFSEQLKVVDEALFHANENLANAVFNNGTDVVNGCKNLDGNIFENLFAESVNVNAKLNGLDMEAKVLESHAKNSVDVEVFNHSTGTYERFQMKFGKTPEDTAKYIMEGNYTSQQIVVPKGQADRVREILKENGCNKTVIEEYIVEKGNKKIDLFSGLSKEEGKQMQKAAQQEGKTPNVLTSGEMQKVALHIGKQAGCMALSSAAFTTGITAVQKMIQGEKIETSELAKTAIASGVDGGIKGVTAGALEIAVQKGCFNLIPRQYLGSDVITGIACVGVENAKVLYSIAKGNISLSKGIDQIGRNTISFFGGFLAAKKAQKAVQPLKRIVGLIPVIGKPLAVAIGVVTGMVAFAAGSGIGEKIHETAKKVATVAKSMAKTVWDGIKSVGRAIGNGIRNFFSIFA